MAVSGAGMGGAIDVEQMGSIDLRIDLGRGQAGMAEQFLKGAKIGAATEHLDQLALEHLYGVR